MAKEHLKSNRFNGLAPDIHEEMEDLFLNNGIPSTKKICYEVIEDFREIKASLHLRYLAFRYVNFIEENEDRLDINSYDKYSTFLGAYNVTGGQKILVGTFRIINGDKEGAAFSYIEELIRTARDPKIRALGKRTKLFPILESFNLPDSYFSCFDKSKPEENSIHPYELSRLAIRPDYWMYNNYIGLYYLLIQYSWMHEPPLKDFLIAVHPRARRRYEKLGFKVIPGTGQVLYKHINQLAIAMTIDLEKYLQEACWYRKPCETLFPDFKKKGYFARMLNKQLPDSSFYEENN
ncbi:MAG TPA: hypothetical protein VM123_09290 [archaeon]|nr:hypothetical protein [archaeon]